MSLKDKLKQVARIGVVVGTTGLAGIATSLNGCTNRNMAGEETTTSLRADPRTNIVYFSGIGGFRNAYITDYNGNVLYTLIENGKENGRMEKSSRIEGGMSGGYFYDCFIVEYLWLAGNRQLPENYLLVVEDMKGEIEISLKDKKVKEKILPVIKKRIEDARKVDKVYIDINK